MNFPKISCYIQAIWFGFFSVMCMCGQDFLFQVYGMSIDEMFPSIATSENKAELYASTYSNFYNLGFSMFFAGLAFIPAAASNDRESQGKLCFSSGCGWVLFLLVNVMDLNAPATPQMEAARSKNLIQMAVMAAIAFGGFFASGAGIPSLKATYRSPEGYPTKSPPWYWTVRYNVLCLFAFGGMFVFMNAKTLNDYNLPKEMQDVTTVLGSFTSRNLRNIGLNFFVAAFNASAILTAHHGITIFRLNVAMAMGASISIASAGQAKMWARHFGHDTSPMNGQITIGIIAVLLFSQFVMTPWMLGINFLMKEAIGVSQDTPSHKLGREDWKPLAAKMKAHFNKGKKE